MANGPSAIVGQHSRTNPETGEVQVSSDNAIGAALSAQKRSFLSRLKYRLADADVEEEDPLRRLELRRRGRGGENVAYLTYNPLSTEGDGPWVSGLYVDPAYRGEGLASRLLEEMERRHRGQTLRLRARPYKDKPLSTEELMKVYESMGYMSYDPEERTRMAKSIPARMKASAQLPVATRMGLMKSSVRRKYPVVNYQLMDARR